MSGSGGGYPSDLADEQWALVEPLLPPARVGPKGGRREKHPRRRIVDAIFYVVRTGCAWRQLPKDFPPWPTVYWYFTWWHDGSVERIHDTLPARPYPGGGRPRRGAERGPDRLAVRPHRRHRPRCHQGLRRGQEGERPQAHVITDTLGLLLAVHVVAASIQDRDGAKRPLPWTRLDHPGDRKVWADQRFADRLVGWTAQILGRDLEIVRKHPGQRGFQAQPTRWAVERTFPWLTAHRRLARDDETSPAHSETMIRRAMIGIMVRRLARGRPATRQGPRSLSRVTGRRIAHPLMCRTSRPTGR
ncbi:IS5 family transposase [Streptomyces sp. PanSC19]|uniref:IS5 family transposase n=1 Tax=Streptomyces sp. PanSC19 TaxID=1520455 RepID=UPI00288983B0|nr:IS5 family transposase [Streptomyces sp. PanSC19]